MLFQSTRVHGLTHCSIFNGYAYQLSQPLQEGRLDMGRQFSYFVFPEDLVEIEREVFMPAKGTLLITRKRDARHHMEAAGPFALALDRMGTESLFLLLLPPSPLGNIVFSGPWLDVSRSHLIEVGRSYIKDGEIGTARFWYEPKPYADGNFVEKPVEFLDWASGIYRRTKKLLARHSYQRGGHDYTDWCGKVAQQALAAGLVAPR